MKNDMIVFDFETGGLDPESCEVIEIAALAVNGVTLEPYDDIFKSLIKPVVQKEDGSFPNLNKDAMEVNRIPIDELKTAPDMKTVMKQFCNYCEQFSRSKNKRSSWDLPIPAGKNIRNFDVPILKRLAKCYKFDYPLHNVRLVDLDDQLFGWFENAPDELPSISMNKIRPYFGLSDKDAHRAEVDVYQTTELIVKFIKLQRNVKNYRLVSGNPLVQFRNSCANSKYGVNNVSRNPPLSTAS